MIYNVRVNGHITVTTNYYQDLKIEAETEEEAIEEALIEADENGLEWNQDVDGHGTWDDSRQDVEVLDAEILSSESNEDPDDQEDE